MDDALTALVHFSFSTSTQPLIILVTGLTLSRVSLLSDFIFNWVEMLRQVEVKEIHFNKEQKSGKLSSVECLICQATNEFMFRVI